MKSSECTTCHIYHAPDPRVPAPLTASTVSFKQMLLGRGIRWAEGTGRALPLLRAGLAAA